MSIIKKIICIILVGLNFQSLSAVEIQSTPILSVQKNFLETTQEKLINYIASDNFLISITLISLIGIFCVFKIKKYIEKIEEQNEEIRILKQDIKFNEEVRKKQEANQRVFEEIESQNNQKTCMICYENEPNSKIFPCMHCDTCYDCAKRLKTCPRCNMPIKSLRKKLFGNFYW